MYATALWGVFDSEPAAEAVRFMDNYLANVGAHSDRDLSLQYSVKLVCLTEYLHARRGSFLRLAAPLRFRVQFTPHGTEYETQCHIAELLWRASQLGSTFIANFITTVPLSFAQPRLFQTSESRCSAAVQKQNFTSLRGAIGVFHYVCETAIPNAPCIVRLMNEYKPGFTQSLFLMYSTLRAIGCWMAAALSFANAAVQGSELLCREGLQHLGEVVTILADGASNLAPLPSLLLESARFELDLQHAKLLECDDDNLSKASLVNTLRCRAYARPHAPACDQVLERSTWPDEEVDSMLQSRMGAHTPDSNALRKGANPLCGTPFESSQSR